MPKKVSTPIRKVKKRRANGSPPRRSPRACPPSVSAACRSKPVSPPEPSSSNSPLSPADFTFTTDRVASRQSSPEPIHKANPGDFRFRAKFPYATTPPSPDPKLEQAVQTSDPSLSKSLPEKIATEPYNYQVDCPLFCAIPPEVRNTIYLFILDSYDHNDHIYPEDTFQSRPGYRARQRFHTNLLATCRLVYLETHLLPIALNTHTFYSSSRAPHSKGVSDDWLVAGTVRSYFKRFTELQRSAIRRVHVFGGAGWLESGFPELCATTRGSLKATQLKLTIRACDWLSFEHNHVLTLEENWGRHLRLVDGLEEVVLEMECVENDLVQVEAIASRMQELVFRLKRGRILRASENDITRRRWTGRTLFTDTAGSVKYDKEEKKWRKLSRSDLKAESASETMPFHILSVNWTL